MEGFPCQLPGEVCDNVCGSLPIPVYIWTFEVGDQWRSNPTRISQNHARVFLQHQHIEVALRFDDFDFGILFHVDVHFMHRRARGWTGK